MANYSIKQHNAHTFVSGSQTSVTIVFTSAQTVGSLNVVTVSWISTATTITSVVDNINGTYTLAATLTHNTTSPFPYQAIYYFPNIASASASANTVTITIAGAGGVTCDCRIAEFASTNGTLWTVHKTVSVASSGATPTSGNTATTTHANDLVFGACSTNGGATQGTGYTLIAQTSNGNADEWKEVTVTGAQAATFVDAGGSGSISVTQVVAFNAASAAVLLAGTNISKSVNSGVLQKALSGTCQAKSVNSGKLSRLLLGTCTVRMINSGVITRSLLGTCTVHSVDTGALKSTKLLAGTCLSVSVNTGVLAATKLLSGTCVTHCSNTGKISRFISGTCTVHTASTGGLAASKLLSGTCQSKSINSGAITRSLLGTCTVHASNTGALGAVKPLTGTCLSHSVNTGTVRSTKPLSGICICSCVNTGKISRFILGTCTVHTASTGYLASSKLLSGTCAAKFSSTGKLSRFLSGSCLIHSVNSGSFTVTRLMFGVCVATSSSTGALQSYRILVGSCTVQMASAGLLTSPAYTAVCTARVVCSGSLSLLWGLYVYSREFVTVQTMNANQVARIMPPGAFLALPVNMIPAPAYDWTTQNLEIHGYKVGTVDIKPVWYVTPQTPAQLVRSAALVYYNNIISKNLVSAFTFADANWGSLTTGNKDLLLQQLVEGVNALLINMNATMLNISGTCVVKSSNSGVLL